MTMAKKVQVKSWKSSTTILFNIVALAVLVAEVFTKQVTGLPEEVTGLMAMVVTLGNVYLRFQTSEPIK